MLAIRLESPGSAIFRQRRTGYRGQVFTILKFRTMTAEAESQTGPMWAMEDESFLSDMYIVLKTVKIVLLGRERSRTERCA